MSADVEAALRVLGLAPGASVDDARRAYRQALHAVHPDRSDHPEADLRTREVVRAWAVVRQALGTTGPAPPPGATGAGAGPAPGPAPAEEPAAPTVPVAVVDDSTFAVGLPRAEVLGLLVDVADRLGEISYLDGRVGLLEVVVEFVEAPPCSVVLTLQGRAATGATDVFVSVESLTREPAPPVAAVVRLLVDALVG